MTDFILQQLETLTTNRLDNNSFYPSTSSNQSLFSQIDTLFLQPFYTFVFLNNNNGNNTNFLEYFDQQLFGDQSSLPYNQQLKWFRLYRNETSENVTLLSPALFKDTWWVDKTSNNQYVDLTVSNKNATMQQAYQLFRTANSSLEFSGTILATQTDFINKWKTLLSNSISFKNTQHHPIYNGTYIWNHLPISLRRKWKLNTVDSSDPFLTLVNMCVSKLFYDFFQTEQSGQLWPLFDAHGLSATQFDPKFFRIPVSNESTKCLYCSLPALWEQLHGRNELEGKWKATSWILQRLTQGLNINSNQIDNLTNQIISVETQIRKVDRTQRFGCSFSQTSGFLQSSLGEIEYIRNNTQLYDSNISGFIIDTKVTENIPRIPVSDHTDYRFTYDTAICDTSPFNVNLTYVQTTNATTDNNTLLQTGFLESETIYELFNTGMVEDPIAFQ